MAILTRHWRHHIIWCKNIYAHKNARA